MLGDIRISIGVRYLFSKKDNRSISFFTLVSLLGLTVGVATIVIVLSVMNGFQDDMHKRILGMVSHIKIELGADETVPSFSTNNWQALQSKIVDDGLKSKITGSAPYVIAEGMLLKADAVKGIRLYGVIPEHEANVSVVDEFMLAGDFSSIEGRTRNIIVGSVTARELGLNIGDEIRFVFPKSAKVAAGIKPKFESFTISGFFNVGAEADALFAYVSLSTLADLKFDKEIIEGLRISVADVYAAESVAEEIKTKLGDPFRVLTWSNQYGQLFQTVRLEKVMTGFMLMLIVLIAALNIVSSLVMLVREKTVSIAVLRTMGMPPADVISIFLVQGVLIGLVGVFAGSVIGVLVSNYMKEIIAWINSLELFWMAPIGAKIVYQDVLTIAIFSFFLALTATVLPALKAGRVEPAEAVKYY